MPELSRDSHPAQPIDITMLSTVIAMPALSESEPRDRVKEASDTLHRQYGTHGSHPRSRARDGTTLTPVWPLPWVWWSHRCLGGQQLESKVVIGAL